MIINPYLVIPSLVTPSGIPNIWDWWEPSRETAYVNNDTMENMTGVFAAKVFSQAVEGSKPIYKTNVINGLAVADFNNQSFNAGPDASALTEGHIWGVLKAANDPGSFGVNTPWRIGTDGSNPDLWPWTDGTVYMGAGRNSRFSTGTDPTPSLADWRVCEVVTTTTEYTVLVDGTSIGTTGTNTVAFKNPITLGEGPSSATWTGQTAGVYIFSAKLTGANRTSMVTYLNSRFALSIV